ncbi:hypothetical protein M8C21_026521 [Ambrosia artemisiifolia]|uniref:Gelsolin-like domain-containing protein n=1 Tax=Ambrosia artemisiifolia TaxID=4212 RepID=A0AAD5CGZ3_AMBAR|nr:hypothetical protein M8C21_026521 [Ambrosia artemisiifolia]
MSMVIRETQLDIVALDQSLLLGFWYTSFLKNRLQNGDESMQEIWLGLKPKSLDFVQVTAPPLAIETAYGGLERVSSGEGKFEVEEVNKFDQDDLLPVDISILDTHVEVFVWIGQAVDPKEKKSTLDYGQVNHREKFGACECGKWEGGLELSELVKEYDGFEGALVWDALKPDGTPRKLRITQPS